MRYYILTLFLLTSLYIGAQNTPNLEASLNIGFASFQSDYGEDGNSKSNFSGNMGLAVGGSLYVNFFSQDPSLTGEPSWSQKHLKLKLEGSYFSAKLEHFADEPITDSRKNMVGRASVINFGTILEYHPFVIPDFVPGIKKKLTPYFGLGIMGTFALPEVDTSNLILAYQTDDEGVVYASDQPVFTYSLMPSAGLRYQLDNGGAIMLDMRWQYFGSDFIDGLNPNNEIINDSNKHNDWLYYLNVGYVFSFGKRGKSSTWGNK